MLNKAQTAFNEFLAKQALSTYNFAGMTDAKKQAEMSTYTALKIAAAQEVEKNKQFVADRDAAFASLESEYAAKRIALQNEWQTKENNLA